MTAFATFAFTARDSRVADRVRADRADRDERSERREERRDRS